MAKGKIEVLSLCSFFILNCVFIFIAGCAGWPWRPAPELREATAEQLTRLLRDREAAIQTMKGLFRAHVKGPGIPFAQRVDGAMFYRRPHTLRLQGFTRLGGGEVFELVVGQDLFRLRLPVQGKMYAGRVEDWERLGEIGRPFQLSVWAMKSAVGVASVTKGEGVTLTEEGDQYRLEIYERREAGSSATTRPRRRIWFERQSLEVVREDLLTAAGELEASIEFEDFRPVVIMPAGVAASADGKGAAPMRKPFKITTHDGRGQGTITVTFQEIVPNPHLKPEELGVARAGGEVESEVEAPERQGIEPFLNLSLNLNLGLS